MAPLSVYLRANGVSSSRALVWAAEFDNVVNTSQEYVIHVALPVRREDNDPLVLLNPFEWQLGVDVREAVMTVPEL